LPEDFDHDFGISHSRSLWMPGSSGHGAHVGFVLYFGEFGRRSVRVWL
jgi:hypothetical protein